MLNTFAKSITEHLLDLLNQIDTFYTLEDQLNDKNKVMLEYKSFDHKHKISIYKSTDIAYTLIDHNNDRKNYQYVDDILLNDLLDAIDNIEKESYKLAYIRLQNGLNNIMYIELGNHNILSYF